MDDKQIDAHREFLKDSLRQTINFRFTDQSQGVPAPALQKPLSEGQQIIELPGADSWDSFRGTDLIDALVARQSRRRYQEDELTQAELSYLLWMTQGIKKELSPGTALRTVPSAGCRHPFETYLLVTGVEDLKAGVYRYLPLEHGLVLEQEDEDLVEKLSPATLGQTFIAAAPVTFVWAVLPYRTEWRYHTAAHRVILLDAGHVCENLYLACQAIGCGTCAVAAFDQEKMDKLLGVDGQDEFCLYLAAVGKC